jgi:hypothetical protein
MISRLTFLKLVATAFVGGCSPAPMPVSRSSSDPSNPNAAEGATPDAASSAPRSKVGAGATEVVYACPMHPEVTSTKPGEVCPKCNMKLVPKK